MNRFLVMTILAGCFLVESCSRSQPPFLTPLQPMRRQIAPRTTSPSRVGPIGRDPLACIVSADVNATALSATACTFNLPAFPVSFTLQCSINVVLTTGTTGNFGLDIVPSASPATSTSIAAFSMQPLAAYGNVLLTSASGDQTVLGGMTGGNLGVNTPANIFLTGSWPSSGTASSFTIAATETTNLGLVVKAGSYCRMSP